SARRRPSAPRAASSVAITPPSDLAKAGFAVNVSAAADLSRSDPTACSHVEANSVAFSAGAMHDAITVPAVVGSAYTVSGAAAPCGSRFRYRRKTSDLSLTAAPWGGAASVAPSPLGRSVGSVAVVVPRNSAPPPWRGTSATGADNRSDAGAAPVALADRHTLG